MNDWKDKLKFAYSTNPDYKSGEDNEITESIKPSQQVLKVWIEKKHRGGKPVSIIEGFVGNVDELKELAKTIKTRCGVGGTVKDGEIIIQGEFRDRIVAILHELGYKNSKKAGG